MFLSEPVSASGKNNCRKLLWPLLLFVLYFFPLKQQSLFLCLVFLRLFGGWVLFCGKRSPREKNRLYVQLAQGDSNQSFVSIITQSQPKISQADRQADLKAVTARMRGQRQRRAAKPRERAAAEISWGGRELWGGRHAVTGRGGKNRQNLLFMVETTFFSHGQGVKSTPCTSLSTSTAMDHGWPRF